MKITLKRIDDDFAFETENEKGNKITLDNSAGEVQKGFTPMELLLAGVGGCSAIDIVHILKKQRQEIESFFIEVDGEKEKVEGYSVWRNINIHYHIKGKVDYEKALRAAELSHQKYCSVSKALSHDSNITFSVTVANS
jgi:putative redox protein